MSHADSAAELVGRCRAGDQEAWAQLVDRFFARDESYRTIGEALELPAGTIASRISRCLAKLKTALEGRNEVASQSGGQVIE